MAGSQTAEHSDSGPSQDLNLHQKHAGELRRSSHHRSDTVVELDPANDYLVPGNIRSSHFDTQRSSFSSTPSNRSSYLSTLSSVPGEDADDDSHETHDHATPPPIANTRHHNDLSEDSFVPVPDPPVVLEPRDLEEVASLVHTIDAAGSHGDGTASVTVASEHQEPYSPYEAEYNDEFDQRLPRPGSNRSSLNHQHGGSSRRHSRRRSTFDHDIPPIPDSKRTSQRHSQLMEQDLFDSFSERRRSSYRNSAVQHGGARHSRRHSPSRRSSHRDSALIDRRQSQRRSQRYSGIGQPALPPSTDAAAPAPNDIGRVSIINTDPTFDFSNQLSPPTILEANAGTGRDYDSTFPQYLYTISYLIFFSIIGTLSRIALSHLTYYPGAPVYISSIWPNFAGCTIMGFLVGDQRFFADEAQEITDPEDMDGATEIGGSAGTDGTGGTGREKITSSSSNHFTRTRRSLPTTSRSAVPPASKKKTIPLYIGLAAGYCGSLTSFSSFMSDAFLSLSNNTPTPYTPSAGYSGGLSRQHAYSLTAVLGVVILTLTASTGGYLAGSNIATTLQRFTPTLPAAYRRRVIDRFIALPLALIAWLAVIILCLIPPDAPDSGTAYAKISWAAETWRADALFALVFAPFGCLFRVFLSTKLNHKSPSFPVGTFVANILASVLLASFYDLQRVPLGQFVGGGTVSCAVLAGLMDGFCGALSTVSTFVAEMAALRAARAYVYGVVSVAVGLAAVIAVMGGVRWSLGWDEPVCSPSSW